MSDKDKGKNKPRQKGSAPEQRETKATKPAAPKEHTKPATKVNRYTDKRPPR